MEKTQIEKELEGLKVARQKAVDGFSGRKSVITYRGIVTLASTGVLASSSVKLVKNVQTLVPTFTNEGIVKGSFVVLGSAVLVALVPLTTRIIIHEVSRLKEDIRMLKFEKKWLEEYNEKIEENTKTLEKYR